MTKTRRTILLLTQIFMLLGGLLAFRNHAAVAAHLPELSKTSPLPALEKGATPEARRLTKLVAETQLRLAVVAGTLGACNDGTLIFGALLLGSSLILFFVTPWKLSQPSEPSNPRP